MRFIERCRRALLPGIGILLVVLPSAASAQGTGPPSDHVLPFQDEHVHGSTLTELSNGDILVAWFQGSGE